MRLFPGASLAEKLQELASWTRGNLLGGRCGCALAQKRTQPELMCSLHPRTREGFVVSGCFLQDTEVTARGQLETESPATVALSVSKMKTPLSKAHALLLTGPGDGGSVPSCLQEPGAWSL